MNNNEGHKWAADSKSKINKKECRPADKPVY